MKFTKMHGLGNDYVYVNGFVETVDDPIGLAKSISDRHFGVGSDGLVLILPSQTEDFRMRMFNSDGSEAEMCGNAIRCVGKYVYDKQMTAKNNLTIETLAGVMVLELFLDEKGKVHTVCVDMGEPILNPRKIPVDSNLESFVAQKVQIGEKKYEMTAVSMGNPHVITYVEDVENYPVLQEGPDIEKDSLFPKKVNAEFVQIMDSNTLKMRVWERGAGETLACGTGACAVLVASVLNGFCKREATVKLLGGDLKISWKEDNHVYMEGPAVVVFEGEIHW
jgi:diaminopimelate epimerase